MPIGGFRPIKIPTKEHITPLAAVVFCRLVDKNYELCYTTGRPMPKNQLFTLTQAGMLVRFSSTEL